MYLFVDPHALLTTGLQFASGLVVRSAGTCRFTQPGHGFATLDERVAPQASFLCAFHVLYTRYRDATLG